MEEKEEIVLVCLKTRAARRTCRGAVVACVASFADFVLDIL